MIDVNDLRVGVTFTMDGELYKVIEYQHSQARPRQRHHPHQTAQPAHRRDPCSATSSRAIA
jgi:hypothetical protein